MTDLAFHPDAFSFFVEMPPKRRVLGFTGTRAGMTDLQATTFKEWLLTQQIDVCEFLHGDCVGADAQAHAIALELGFAVGLYPPADDTLRAFCQGAEYSKKPSPYLTRNAAIVRDCDALVACPAGPEPRSRRAGGTWFTIREARRVGRHCTIIWPDGTVE